MKIAIVGCGYVADYYVLTLPNHPWLELVGVADRAADRARRFSAFHSVPSYDSLDALLADERVELVVNLTNPDSHYEVTKACLEAGRHVYSEKPLAMRLADAVELVELAERRGLYVTSAPCNVLGEAAQTMWRVLREGALGTVRLAYAEMDDGLIHRMRYREWKSVSGIPWPWKDEFEVGCTLEHAGYYVTWLVAFFGPAESVTAYARCLVPDKETDEPLDRVSPDFSTATIQFRSGVVARLTCSIFAPHSQGIRIFGDDGVLTVEESWDYRAPVVLERRTPLALRLEKWPLLARLLRQAGTRVPLARPSGYGHRTRRVHSMDFSRGVAELAAAARDGRPAPMSARFALHVNEIVLAIEGARESGFHTRLTTTCEPMEPLPWAGGP